MFLFLVGWLLDSISPLIFILLRLHFICQPSWTEQIKKRSMRYGHETQNRLNDEK